MKAEDICHKCEIFQKFINSIDRPLACETARAVGRCLFEKEINRLREGIKLVIINYDGGSMFQSGMVNILRDLIVSPKGSLVNQKSEEKKQK